MAIICQGQALSYPINHPPVYACQFTNANIIIDGQLNEEEWAAIKTASTFVDISGGLRKKQNQAIELKLQWNENYLFIAAKLFENNIEGKILKKDSTLFKENCFELFFDPKGQRKNYFEIEINAQNTVWDLLMPSTYTDGGLAQSHFDFSTMRSAVFHKGTINNRQDIDEYWSVEIAIPWTDFNIHKTPDLKEVWRMNAVRIDWEKPRFKNTARPFYACWSPQYKFDMHRPEMFGYIQFTNKKSPLYSDSNWNKKMALMEVYYLQKEYFKKYKQYSNSYSELNPSENNFREFNQEIIIKSRKNKYCAFFHQEKKLQINQSGLLSNVDK